MNGQLEVDEKPANHDCIDIHRKTRCLEMMSPRCKNATINCDLKIVKGQLVAVEEKSANDGCKDVRLGPRKSKSQDYGKVQNTIRTHSTIAAPNLCNRKPLLARRITLLYWVCLLVTHALRFLRCRIRNWTNSVLSLNRAGVQIEVFRDLLLQKIGYKNDWTLSFFVRCNAFLYYIGLH